MVRRAGRPNAGLATLCLVLFLTFLDNTIVTVVLADVQSGFHTGVSQLQWVVNGYALVFASLMLTFGTLSDLFGRKKVMLGGVAVFCAGSVVAAVAPDVHVLIIGRVVMGVGAAASEPGTLSMIRHLFPDGRDRARALGVWAAVSSAALALGPVIGGTLAGIWSWRAIFWFNVLFGVVAFVGAAWTLPENADPGNRRLDFGGFVLGAGALASATFAVTAGETVGYRTWWIEALFGAALACALGFVLFERRAANPVLDVRYFRRPGFSGANVVAFSTYFSIFALFFFVALYLQVVGNDSPYRTALDFVPMAGGMVVASLAAGPWVAARGPRLPMVLGCLLAGVGVLLTNTYITPQAGVGDIGWTMALSGLGFGLALVPVTSSALSSVPPEHSGMAASMTNTSRELGAVAGVSVLGSVVNGQLTVNLLTQLSAIGIPKAFQSQVVAAVTTGSFNSEAAKAVSGNAQIAAIVHKVVNAAYAAFAHGLSLSLMTAGALMFVSALVAVVTMGVPRTSQPAGSSSSPSSKPRVDRAVSAAG
jgi:EmrB/QacA subfamily drug resistance transporter